MSFVVKTEYVSMSNSRAVEMILVAISPLPRVNIQCLFGRSLRSHLFATSRRLMVRTSIEIIVEDIEPQ